MSGLTQLPSIKVAYALLDKVAKATNAQLEYENSNVEITSWQKGFIELCLSNHDTISIDNVNVFEPLTPREIKLGMQAGKCYNIEKLKDLISIRIYGDNDVAYNLLSKIKGVFNGILAEELCRHYGVMPFTFPELTDSILETHTGGATVRCLHLDYNMIYSLANEIIDDVEVSLYKKIEINELKLEE